MRINIEKLVQLLDGREVKYSGHITSVIGLVGEDINTEIFIDYLKTRKSIKDKDIEIESKVNTGRKKGPHLDRWIRAGKNLYQVEIKNWCSFQFGGYELPLNVKKQEIGVEASKKWERELRDYYENKEEINKVNKVLVEMKVPVKLSSYRKNVQPLVIHWMPISNNGVKPFFSVPIKFLGLNNSFPINFKFTKVNYFSSSIYLRELIKNGKEELDLNLPNFKTRIEMVNQFINIKIK